MKFGYNSKQIFAGLTFGLLVMTGTYNAIVINSESTISGVDMRFAKRLDEVYGNIESKREFASAMNWQKLNVKQAALVKNMNPDRQLQKAATGEESAPVESMAAVKEELSLNLTAVINPKKWQQGLTPSQFNGNLSTNSGVIESLSVSLPNGEGLSVSFSEMTGNVFEYDYEGELYSGMMYQEGQNSYVVSLTNGPLEGTRLTFTGEASAEQQIQLEESQRSLAENMDSSQGTQAEPQAMEVAQADQDLQAEQQQEAPALETAEAPLNPYAQEPVEMNPEQAQLTQPEDQNQAAM